MAEQMHFDAKKTVRREVQEIRCSRRFE